MQKEILLWSLVHADDYVTHIVYHELQKEMLALTTLNVLIGHHLGITEADWSAH